MVKSHEMDSLAGPVCNSGGHIITIFKKISLTGELYSVMWYITVGMSATVGEMSATVGKCQQQWGEMSAQWGKCPQQWGVEYALRNLRLEIVINNSS